MSYLCPPFVKDFCPPPQKINVYIIVFIARTNTGQLSYLCPPFVLTKAHGPWPIAHSPPNPLPTKTKYRQMLDNVLPMYSFCPALKSVVTSRCYVADRLSPTAHPSQPAHHPLPMHPPLPTYCPPAPPAHAIMTLQL